MAQFSENEINEAKKRVWEMRNRASQLVGDSPKAVPSSKNENRNTQTQKDKEQNITEPSEEKSDDKSFLVILALILLLSREGADNTLILALLYLLL